MDKFNRFVSRHLANIALVGTFSILVNEIAILCVCAGWTVRWVAVAICDGLLMCDWMYLFGCWKRFEKEKEVDYVRKICK